MGNFQKYGHVMIDLETLSTHTNAAIIEIGAVEFNKETGEIGDKFSVRITPSDWCNNGRHVDGETIVWWMKQSEDARKRYTERGEGLIMNLKAALVKLSAFIRNCSEQVPSTDHHDTVVVWGNGATMDITILESAYEYFGETIPWKYWAVNDVRTIVDLNPSVKKGMKFDGVKHSAIDDCKHQIKYLVATLNTLKKTKYNDKRNTATSY